MMWEGIREAKREDLSEDTLKVYREFQDWFLPATAEDVGREFIIFLHWLDKKDYVIKT